MDKIDEIEAFLKQKTEENIAFDDTVKQMIQLFSIGGKSSNDHTHD